jgi:ACR3 family arsenite transporter
MKNNDVRLSILDILLPLWIVLAMVAGVLIGNAFSGISDKLGSVKIANVSLPIAIGLLWMMYPVLAKVKYEELGHLAGKGKVFGLTLGISWIVGPIVMFGLSWLLLPDMPEYRTGMILVSLAPCIAMVLIWNMLAKGSNEIAAVLVAINSILQVLLYSFLAFFYLMIVPNWFGMQGTHVPISMWEVAKSVLIFLGIPLLAGFLTRKILIAKKGLDWYEGSFLKKLSPTALVGLLYTIVLMFAMQGEKILSFPLDVLRISAPLLLFFGIMWTLTFIVSKKSGFTYSDSATAAFTASSNNFELAIAVAISIFGIQSKEALATVVGPLIEVPVLLLLVYVSLWAMRFFANKTTSKV